jgi:glycine/D-amino acid oxidase-like deaminating enzyme
MKTDVLIVGAGIIGAAVAEQCARRGLRTRVLEAGVAGAGTTAASMGHLVVLDGDPAELSLSRRGLALWRARRRELPATADYRNCGTIWVARDDQEQALAEQRSRHYGQHDIECELLTADALYQAEPELAPGCAGGLLMPAEATLYPPAACAWLLEKAREHGAELFTGADVTQVEDGGALLASGEYLAAERVVVAAGCQTPRLLGQVPLSPRRGHLLITDRHAHGIRHQLLELGYLQSAHGSEHSSVAFNVQPRSTGQLLIGSSREPGVGGHDINWPLLGRMLRRAIDFLPALRNTQAVRCWTGLRPCTPDNQPLLGLAPGYRQVWLATGHEGLGITTALASAELLAALLEGEAPALDPSPYRPDRFTTHSAVRPQGALVQ